jgi:hypothetical protein
MSSSKLDPVRDGRSPSEVLFKTLAIYAATAGAVGHLTTLRKTSDSEEAVAEMEVLGFLFFPTMPLASTVHHTWRTARLGLRHWQAKFARSGNGFGGNMMLYVSACLGARAIFSVHGAEQPEGADSILLYRVAYSDRITSTTCEFNLRWFGRLLILAALLAQAAATFILGVRRCLHDQALTATDVRNMFLAFGGAWAEMLAISLTLINRDWYVEREARHAVTTNRVQLSEIIFDGLYAVQSSNHLTTSQLKLASWALKALNLAHVTFREAGALIMGTFMSFRSLDQFLFSVDESLHYTLMCIIVGPFIWVHPLVPLDMFTSFAYIIPLSAVLSSIGRGRRLRNGDWLHGWLSTVAVGVDIVTTLAAILWLVLDLRRIAYARKTGIWDEMLWQDEWATFLWAF